jgi:TubC N-terminal docking domain
VTPREVLAICQRRSVALSVAGERLKLSGPAGSLDEELKALLAEHKPALLELVAPCPKCGRPMDALKCWHCHYRRCSTCKERDTGSALISTCLPCQLATATQA